MGKKKKKTKSVDDSPIDQDTNVVRTSSEVDKSEAELGSNKTDKSPPSTIPGKMTESLDDVSSSIKVNEAVSIETTSQQPEATSIYDKVLTEEEKGFYQWGFGEEDIKSPSLGVNINTSVDFPALPGEKIDDYMKRWMSRHKLELSSSIPETTQETEESQSNTKGKNKQDDKDEESGSKEDGKVEHDNKSFFC